jgi:hypothetical protein
MANFFIEGGKKAKFKKGMTEGTAVNARNKIKTQKDVEDMIDEEQDSDNESVRKKRENEKSKMKKISNKVKNKDGKDADQKANKKNVKDKLARAQDKIKKMMANKNEGNKGGNDGGSMDPVATANQRKEFDKNSNAQIMNKIAESEQNHGDLTFGSYIILNLNGENDDSRKFSTQFRISDKVQAHKMDKEDYNEN